MAVETYLGGTSLDEFETVYACVLNFTIEYIMLLKTCLFKQLRPDYMNGWKTKSITDKEILSIIFIRLNKFHLNHMTTKLCMQIFIFRRNMLCPPYFYYSSHGQLQVKSSSRICQILYGKLYNAPSGHQIYRKRIWNTNSY